MDYDRTVRLVALVPRADDVRAFLRGDEITVDGGHAPSDEDRALLAASTHDERRAARDLVLAELDVTIDAGRRAIGACDEFLSMPTIDRADAVRLLTEVRDAALISGVDRDDPAAWRSLTGLLASWSRGT